MRIGRGLCAAACIAVMLAVVGAVDTPAALASASWSGPTSSPVGGGDASVPGDPSSPPTAAGLGVVGGAISCLSASFCAAGGGPDGDALIYNGSTWTTQTGVMPYAYVNSNIALAGVDSVSCVTTGFCAVAGYNDSEQATVSFYYGSFWTASGLTGLQFYSAYYAPTGALVSCTSTSFCLAVAAGVAQGLPAASGTYTGESSTYNGHTWTAQVAFGSTGNPSGNPYTNGYSVTSLSCAPATTFCVAVDSFGSAMTFNGSTWSAPDDIDGTTSLVSVSCASASLCVAVDHNDNVFTYTGAWSGPVAIGFGSLNAVSCASVSFCDAVYGTGDVATYNGVSWGTPVNIDNAALNWVDCASDSFCLAGDNNGGLMTYATPASPVPAGGGSPGSASASAGHASVTGKTASTRLTCKGNTGSSCTIVLDLTTIETLESGKVVAVAAKVRKTKRTVTIGRKRLTLTGGQSEIVRVALIATGQRLLTRLHKLPAELTVMDGTKKLSRQSLTFRAAEKKKKP